MAKHTTLNDLHKQIQASQNNAEWNAEIDERIADLSAYADQTENIFLGKLIRGFITVLETWKKEVR